MADSREMPPRWRLDAIALVLYGMLGVIAVALWSYGPMHTDQRSNPIGPLGDFVARLFTDSLGLGALTACLGGFCIVSLYVARRTVPALLIRMGGWSILAVVSASFADLSTHQLQMPVSAFGRGGSIGAFVRFHLEDALLKPGPIIGLSILGVIGLALAMPRLTKRFLQWNWWTVRVCGKLLHRGNKLVEVGGDQFLHVAGKGFQSVSKVVVQATKRPNEVEEILALAEAQERAERQAANRTTVPIIRHTGVPKPMELYTAGREGADDSSIPQSRIETPVAPPPILRIVSETDDDLDEHDHSDQSTLPNVVHSYELPSLGLLSDADPYPVEDHEQHLRERGLLLEKAFNDFGLNIKVVGIHTGPVITQYEVALETGLRLNKVMALSDDIALALGVPSVRIVASIPGRNTVGVEVPNEHRQTVRLKELIQATSAKSAKFKLPIYLGKDVEGKPLVYDMATMPHLLIAGRTGTGKSVCLNVIIQSFLCSRRPDECRLILIDPKKVEFSDYSHIPHLMHPVVTDDRKAEAILAWAVEKMEERYEWLRRARVRNIASYNELSWEEIVRRVDPQTEDERKLIPRSMPYIVLVVDEVGDLILSMKKEVETHIIRLAQKSRASGIHLILATQRPTVDVVTGLIKSNLPARICFQVASRADSAVVLDEKGAEKLLGMGDMLFLQPGTSTIIRGQGAYVDDSEIQRITGMLSQYEPNFESELLNLKANDASVGDLGEKLRDRDPLYEQAIEVVIREQRGSTSLLQRALGIGYGRASRLIDFMAEDGIVGGYNGSNAREVLMSAEDWEFRKKGA